MTSSGVMTTSGAIAFKLLYSQCMYREPRENSLLDTNGNSRYRIRAKINRKTVADQKMELNQ
jgi:hypothetical protein